MEKYDVLLVHNVLQYLEPEQNQSIDSFDKKLRQAFDFFHQALKVSGVISIINESKIVNSPVKKISETFHNIKELYAAEKVGKAFIYTKLKN